MKGAIFRYTITRNRSKGTWMEEDRAGVLVVTIVPIHLASPHTLDATNVDATSWTSFGRGVGKQ